MIGLSRYRQDVLASIVVFLVATPLCLGIALASGAPLFAGIVTGVIGGIIVGFLSESKVSVSGPAAGMIAVVLAAISQLGSYEAFLLALFIAGIIQIAGGVLRAGFIANYVPSTVIKGLLAAIGILIIVKQLPLAFGYFAEAGTVKTALKIAQETLNFEPLLDLLDHVNVGATIISVISLVILIVWPKIPQKFFKVIPPSFVVILVAIVLDEIILKIAPAYALGNSHLVNIPVNENLSDILIHLKHPTFSQWLNAKIYLYAFMIAIVASLETLLNLEAIEKLDSRHRYCSRDRELVAQGVGNIVSGLIGGLPITSVIVRSSVNINAGAQSKISTILHGILLLLSLTFLAEWINHIPIAALSAILIYTGYKLARISLFKEVYQEGWRYFIPFIITIIAIVFTNLLLGIIIGLMCSIFFILQHNSKSCFTIVDEKHPSGDVLRLILPQQATFLNRAAIIDGLNNLPDNSKVVIDAVNTDYIDEDIIEVIKDFKESLSTEKNILLNLEGFQNHYKLDLRNSFINATTYDVQASLTPATILTILREGNNRFVTNMPIHRNYKQGVHTTAKSQHPIAVVLSCIDSRVPVELIFDLSLGDLFVIRIAGNIANLDILGSIEFACQVAGSKLIVVLGHKNCGAIKAACSDFKMGHVTQLIEKIKPAVQVELDKNPGQNPEQEEFVANVAKTNAQMTKSWLYHHSTTIKNLVDSSQVGLISGFYDVSTGMVEFDENN